jgi:hypothetical protein
MTAMNFNLRGVSPQVMSTLKKRAKELKISVNVLILRLIEEGIGMGGKPRRSIYHDLDFMIGTWTSKESKEFDQSISHFEKIDKEFWK